MPRIASWSKMPPGVRQHLAERMRDRNISLDDLNRLRLWVESQPEVPEGDWFKDFGSFKLCGKGEFPKTFLLPGQAAEVRGRLARPAPSGFLKHVELGAPSRLRLAGWGFRQDIDTNS